MRKVLIAVLVGLSVFASLKALADSTVASITTGIVNPTGACTFQSGLYFQTITQRVWVCLGTTWIEQPGGPVALFDLFEDFVAGGSTSTTIGTNGLGFSAVASGSIQAPASVTSTANNIGLLELRSHTTNDNSGILLYAGSLTAGNNYDAAIFEVDWSFDTVVIPVSITNVALYVGAMSGNPDSATDAIWVRFDTDRSDATWVFQVCDASGAAGCGSAGDDTDSAVVASTVAPQANVPNRIQIYRRAAGVGGVLTYYFQVNDETPLTFCASGCTESSADAPISTDTLGVNIFWVTRTTTGAQSSYVDYLRFTAPVDRY